MESIALTRAGLQNVPVNSFKGYWGHTLGASGVIESIMCVYSMRKNILFPTKGFQESGLKNPLCIVDNVTEKEVNTCLKIASGFGGCNCALFFHGDE
jgi:3-oxoacyl-[acyl-carrier-protein] synthase-1